MGLTSESKTLRRACGATTRCVEAGAGAVCRGGRRVARGSSNQNSWHPRVFSARRRGTDASARAIARRSRVPRPRGVRPRPLMNAHFSAVLLAPMSGADAAMETDGAPPPARGGRRQRVRPSPPARIRARRVLGHPTAAIRPRPRLPDAAPPPLLSPRRVAGTRRRRSSSTPSSMPRTTRSPTPPPTGPRTARAPPRGRRRAGSSSSRACTRRRRRRTCRSTSRTTARSRTCT